MISKTSGVSLEKMHSRIRRQDYADARAAVWYIAYHYLNYSYNLIARLYHKDHTTIIHGVKRITGTKSEIAIEELVKRELPYLSKMEKPRPTMIETWVNDCAKAVDNNRISSE